MMNILFENLLGQKCNEKKTKSILNAIISNDETNKNKSSEIDEIEYYNIEVHTSKYSKNERTTIVDIHAKDNKNKVDYLIEMQILKDKNMLNRIEFNNSKILKIFNEKGKSLSTNQKVYSINILYFNIFHPNDENYDKYFHTLFAHEPGDVENSIQNKIYIFIELPRYKYENFEKGNMLHSWLSFLKSIKVTFENIENENIENENIENENIESEETRENIKKKYKRAIKINIPFDIYKEIIKVEEIKESFEICEKRLEKIDENNYSAYSTVTSEIESTFQYAKEMEMYAKEMEMYAKEMEMYAKEKEEENKKLKNQLNELKKLLNEMIQERKEKINNESKQERKEEINNESNNSSKKRKIL